MEIGFQQNIYTANEGDDFVEVCVSVYRGFLQRSVEVTMNTEDGTATGLYQNDAYASSVTCTLATIKLYGS